MNPYVYLFLFVLGILIMHIGSYFTMKLEQDSRYNPDPNVYACALTVVFLGLFLSVHGLIKMRKDVNEQVKEVS